MKQSLKVFPSIAAGNLMQLENEVRKLEVSGADGIHFDVMDGHFVPLLTIGVPFIEQMRAITKAVLDVHIMVSNPDLVYQDYLNAGADILCFHPEVAKHAHRICTKIKESGKQAGVALNPATHWNTIEYLLPCVDVITVMTVNPGFSRQPHLPDMHPKIAALSDFRLKNKLNFKIQVDGGVTAENAFALAQLGVDSVVAGGAVFNHDNYHEAVLKIKKSSAIEK